MSDFDQLFAHVDMFTWISVLPNLLTNSTTPQDADQIVSVLLKAVRSIPLPLDVDSVLFYDSAALIIRTLVPYCLSKDEQLKSPSFLAAFTVTSLSRATAEQILLVLKQSSDPKTDVIRIVPVAMTAAFRLVGQHMTNTEKKRAVMAAVFEFLVTADHLTKSERIALISTLPTALSSMIDVIYTVKTSDTVQFVTTQLEQVQKCCTLL